MSNRGPMVDKILFVISHSRASTVHRIDPYYYAYAVRQPQGRHDESSSACVARRTLYPGPYAP
jgi:hypothetical protein